MVKGEVKRKVLIPNLIVENEVKPLLETVKAFQGRGRTVASRAPNYGFMVPRRRFSVRLVRLVRLSE